MGYRVGNVARRATALVIPVVGGALATYGELVWGAAAVAALLAATGLRRYAATAAVAFGLFVLARASAGVTARGAVAVLLGLAALVAVAYVLSLWRRKTGGEPTTAQWVVAFTAVCAVAAAGAAALIAGPATVNLVLAPLAAVAAILAVPAAQKLSRAALIALVIGLALGSIKGAISFGLAHAADEALSRGDYAEAAKYARYAAFAGRNSRAALIRLKAAVEGGAPWPELEALSSERDPLSSPRPFDAALATAAFARGNYEKAAMYGDLATTPSPTSPVRDKPITREDLYDAFAARAESPFARAWAELWFGNYAKAAAAFSALTPANTDARWHEALALERAGDREAAADIYETLWRGERHRLRAGFGLLRTRKYKGLRGEIWRSLGTRYPEFCVGTKLEAVDGFRLSKQRLSLGRKPATVTFDGGGWRTIAVVAESYGALGLHPIVTLTVDGNAVRTFYMNVPGEDIYRAAIDLGPGRKRVGLVFENDYADPGHGLDRNVFVREVRIGGEY